MTRAELIRRFVLNEICDDYEEIEHVTNILAREGAKCGLAVDRADVWRALSELVDGALAKAWRLHPSHKSPDPFEGMPSPRDCEDRLCYFLATESGIQLQLSDGNWYPFDDDGKLREDWAPPT